jgi:hypothetical protein
MGPGTQQVPSEKHLLTAGVTNGCLSLSAFLFPGPSHDQIPAARNGNQAVGREAEVKS